MFDPRYSFYGRWKSKVQHLGDYSLGVHSYRAGARNLNCLTGQVITFSPRSLSLAGICILIASSHASLQTSGRLCCLSVRVKMITYLNRLTDWMDGRDRLWNYLRRDHLLLLIFCCCFVTGDRKKLLRRAICRLSWHEQVKKSHLTLSLVHLEQRHHPFR